MLHTAYHVRQPRQAAHKVARDGPHRNRGRREAAHQPAPAVRVLFDDLPLGALPQPAPLQAHGRNAPASLSHLQGDLSIHQRTQPGGWLIIQDLFIRIPVGFQASINQEKVIELNELL